MARETREKSAGAVVVRGEDWVSNLPAGEMSDEQRRWFEAFAGCIDPGFEVDSEGLIDEGDAWGR